MVRYVAGLALHRRWLGLEVFGQHVEGPAAHEGWRAGDHGVGDQRQGVDVAASVNEVAASLLRRHVAWIAQGGPQGGLGALGRLHQLGQAEVQQLDEVFLSLALGEEDVARPDVAVHEAQLVGLVQGVRHLLEDLERAGLWELLFATQRGGQGLAVEELHREEDAIVRADPEVGGLDDVVAVDLGQRRRLLTEAVHRRLILAQLGVQQLDRDLLPQHDVLAAVDRPAVPFPNPLQQHIAIGDYVPQ